MIGSPAAWLIAVCLGVLIHVDWHLGRPSHDPLSFDLSYHWLLAIATFAPLPWLLIRRWPSAFPQVSTFVIVLGALLGQGLEPLGEVIHSDGAARPFTDAVRWRVFGEFMAAGVPTYAAAAFALKRKGGAAA